MREMFEIGAGSVIGRDHLRVLGEKNNQDSFAYVCNDLLFAVVTDGCGSEKNSEVGAKIGARVMVELLGQVWASFTQDGKSVTIDNFLGINYLLSGVARIFLDKLRLFSEGLNFAETIREEFLFTVMGLVITPTWTAVFSAGDGVYAVNGEVTVLDSGPNNQPDYPAYALFSPPVVRPSRYPFKIRTILATDQVSSILIGTDGLNDLIAAEEKTLPGKQEFVGPLSQFWEESQYFVNPDQVRRRLALINREFVKGDWENQRLLKEPGLLHDDTTLIVVRRKMEDTSGSTA